MTETRAFDSASAEAEAANAKATRTAQPNAKGKAKAKAKVVQKSARKATASTEKHASMQVGGATGRVPEVAAAEGAQTP